MYRLLQPINIGDISLRNRIVFPPVTTGYENRGMITPRSRNFYRNIARGGAGLIIIGDMSIQPSFTQTPFVYDDSFVPGLRDLVDDVHAEGACIAAQLFHQEYDAAEVGRIAKKEGREASMQKLHRDMNDYCNRLTEADIAVILERFRSAARRVRDAGFDLIQVHGDRLLGMFTSGLLNKRTDVYGGSLRNRARFPIEVVQAIREAVPEMPIEYKLAVIRTGPPMGKAGPTLEEAQVMVEWLEEAGVDGFHVALANHSSIGDTIPAMGTQPFGCFVDMAETIKQVSNVPVTAVGRIVDHDQAEELLASGKADLVGICRGIIAEPNWPRGIEQDERETLRKCIMCNHCASSLMSGEPMRCAINATIGEESNVAIEPAAEPRRVLVIGSGPAGMEAAHIAAQRGHSVTLVEEKAEIGGQLDLCAAAPHKHEITKLTEYLVTQLRIQNVQVKVGADAPIGALLDELKPDAVIVATGVVPAMPAVLGIDRPEVMSAWDAMRNTERVGKSVAIIGGGSVGVEAALLLASLGSHVTLVEMSDQIATGESPTILPFIHSEIERYGIRVLKQHRLDAIEDDGLHLIAADGTQTIVTADTVVVAVGTNRNPDFHEELTARGIEYHVVGDSAENSPGTIAGAIHDGFWAGMRV
ncbi:MAG: FAD-dependent oxidoreductase [Pyrinomonadaceae bacterium]